MKIELNAYALVVDKKRSVERNKIATTIYHMSQAGNFPRLLTAYIIAENNQEYLVAVVGNVGNYADKIAQAVSGRFVSDEEAKKFKQLALQEEEIYS